MSNSGPQLLNIDKHPGSMFNPRNHSQLQIFTQTGSINSQIFAEYPTKDGQFFPSSMNNTQVILEAPPGSLVDSPCRLRPSRPGCQSHHSRAVGASVSKEKTEKVFLKLPTSKQLVKLHRTQKEPNILSNLLNISNHLCSGTFNHWMSYAALLYQTSPPN